ncbi:MAG: MaoC family dehydratase N-terminal domain-containing protein [Pseudomonadota bacterium]
MEKRAVLNPITEKEVELFRKATLTESEGFPLTFPTRFRELEFGLLKEIKADIQQLLHTDQSYEYHAPLQVGDVPEITTRIKENREKRGMQFLVFETIVTCAGVKKVTSEAQMVIRLKQKGSA